MKIREYVIYSHLAPPRTQQGVLSRPRVTQTILDNISYPLLVIQAGTGYGKSTELVNLTESLSDFYWYSIQEQDRDPFLFLAKLFSAFANGPKKIGESAIRYLESDQLSNFHEVLTIFMNDLSQNLYEDTYLILDDFHHVLDQQEIEQIITTLVDNSPSNFHLIISTRRLPVYKAIPRWRVKSQLKIINRTELAFTKNEIISLFTEKFSISLSDQQAELIFRETEGWAIALQIIWQSIQRGNLTIEQVFTQRPLSLDSLFEYLASEVLIQLPEELQKFLITVSILDILEIDACNMLMENDASEKSINLLQERGLFITSLPNKTYQFQNLFHDFLRSQLKRDKEKYLELNKKCANYYFNQHRYESAIFHLLEAELFEEARTNIENISSGMINLGRLETILKWISSLPEYMVQHSAEIQLSLGEVKRLKSDFEGSLLNFQRAEKLFTRSNMTLGISKALRGQSQIYLDTIRPLKAEALLEEALQILEPQEYKLETAALLDQLAENKLNLGRPEEAKELHHEAQLLRDVNDPGIFYLEARSHLRTGRLDEGRALLEDQLVKDETEERSRPQRFHRETPLLMSLICIFQGDWITAKENALEGIRIGKQLNSVFVEAVGYIRLGHAYEIQGINFHQANLISKAIDCYETAIEKVRIFKVTRVQVEPLWGLSRSHGYQGNILEAQKYAKAAIEISDQAGDKWLSNLALLTLGASYFFAGQLDDAQIQFTQTIEGFKQVSDSFGLAASLMWQMICYWYDGEQEEALQILKQLFPLVRAGNYTNLLSKPTYLGLKDEQIIIPILIKAYQNKIERSYIEQLLRRFDLEMMDYHPGYRINIQSMGVFRVWRGDTRIRSIDWQRDKAKKLFQLLLINQNEWLNRELIIERLWPDLPLDAAIRDFKVALNSINKALEPDRPKGSNPFFIIRKDNLYTINPQAKIWWDVNSLKYLSEKDDNGSLEEARSLYNGEFLADNLYDDWTFRKREEVKQIIIVVLEKLSGLAIQDEDYDQAIRFCEELLNIEPTWESAYRNLMLAFAGKDNQAQISVIYNRMKSLLSEELNVNPSDTTEKLFSDLTK